jgi:hypothetical protein
MKLNTAFFGKNKTAILSLTLALIILAVAAAGGGMHSQKAGQPSPPFSWASSSKLSHSC